MGPLRAILRTGGSMTIKEHLHLTKWQTIAVYVVGFAVILIGGYLKQLNTPRPPPEHDDIILLMNAYKLVNAKVICKRAVLGLHVVVGCQWPDQHEIHELWQIVDG